MTGLVSVTAGADTNAAAGALTNAADDDTRSATLLGVDEDAGMEIDADSDEGPAEDEEEDDDSDAVDDPPECSALNPVEI